MVALQFGEKVDKPLTAVQDCVSTFVSATPPDILIISWENFQQCL